MIIMGWIFSILGAILSIMGIAEYNSAKSEVYGLYKYYDSSRIDTASMIIGIGIILLVLGVVLLIIGYLNRNNKKRNEVDMLSTCLCLKCGNIADNSKAFCTKCGNDLKAQKKLQ